MTITFAPTTEFTPNIRIKRTIYCLCGNIITKGTYLALLRTGPRTRTIHKQDTTVHQILV